MADSDKCEYLNVSGSAGTCRLRNVKLAGGEVKAKCLNSDLYSICVDAYSSLGRAHDSIEAASTDAFPWLFDAASHFVSLGELDNAVMAYVKGINLAISLNLNEQGYDMFCSARDTYEEGAAGNDPSLRNPAVKKSLIDSGLLLIGQMKKAAEGSALEDVRAELKATVLGGVSQKTEREEKSEFVVVDGRQLYEKKAQEYRDGAETYMQSGMFPNAITFACMGALADLMLGRPKEGLVYLTKFADDSGKKEEFNENTCFIWTKLIFRAHVGDEIEAIEEARKLFFDIPWSFKDDREFARRIMDSVYRRITQ